jgi:predicted PurR-regulated permease PerM
MTLLARLAACAVVVLILALGRPVLQPIALAAVLALILAPPVRWLERHVPRVPALLLVLLLALGAVGGAGYVLVTQLDDLATQVGKYTESMRRKVMALQAGPRWPLGQVEAMVTRVADGLERSSASKEVPVQVAPARATRAVHLFDLFRPLAEPLVTGLFVVVLCVFMLARRDDLRSRLIRLVGTSNVTTTTRALDDGLRRFARYLRDQTIINAIFGGLVGTGLYFIGIPNFVLWGTLAALARFVPYVGAIAAMVMPAALAFAIYPGWARAIATVGLFAAMDLGTAYVIEPLIFGRRTGVSSIALLVSAFFWTWLWGPIGLVLAIPITVALAVLGRHVPDLEFLAVLLGDDQVIGTEISFYQRLLARDEDGAAELARARLAELGRAGVMDEMVIPSLALAARDRGRRAISADDHGFIVAASRDVVESLEARVDDAGSSAPGRRILGVAAHRPDGEILLEMLAGELPPAEARLVALPSTASLDEVLARIGELSPCAVCIGTFPPEGGPHARRMCGGIKASHPDLPVVVFRPREPGIDPALATRRLRDAGADLVVATLADASAALPALLGRR